MTDSTSVTPSTIEMTAQHSVPVEVQDQPSTTTTSSPAHSPIDANRPLSSSSSFTHADNTPQINNNRSLDKTPLSTTDEDYAENIQSNGVSLPPSPPTLREVFPQVLVLPHLLSKNVWLLLTATTLVVTIYIWCYLGALWSPFTRVKNAEIIFYNGDAGFDYSNTPAQVQQIYMGITKNQSLGTMVQGQIMTPGSQINSAFSWIDLSQQEPAPTRDDLIQMIDNGDYWGLVYVPSNFSQNFLSYAPSNSGNATNPMLVDIQYVYDQGRNYSTQSILNKFMRVILDGIAKGFATALLTSSISATLLSTLNTTFWIQPMHTSEFAMHAVNTYGQNFASYIVFLVMYVGSLLTVYCICKYIPNTVEELGVLAFPQGLHKFPAVRIAGARMMLAAMFSAFHAIFIWMAPQVLVYHQLDEKTHPIIALLFIWFAGLAFMSLLFLMATLLTVDGFQMPGTLFLIIQLTTSGAILDWVVMPGFFRVGIVFPFTYAVRGMRTLYFGSLQNKMWINWLVLAGWILVTSLLNLVLARSEIRSRRKLMRSTVSSTIEVSSDNNA